MANDLKARAAFDPHIQQFAVWVVLYREYPAGIRPMPVYGAGIPLQEGAAIGAVKIEGSVLFGVQLWDFNPAPNQPLDVVLSYGYLWIMTASGAVARRAFQQVMDDADRRGVVLVR